MPEVYTEIRDLVNPGYTYSTRNVGSLETRFADFKIFPGDKIQTHKRFKRTLNYYDIDTQSANVRGNPLRQATKRHLNNS